MLPRACRGMALFPFKIYENLFSIALSPCKDNKERPWFPQFGIYSLDTVWKQLRENIGGFVPLCGIDGEVAEPEPA